MTPYPPDPVRAVGPMRLVLTSYPGRDAAVAAAQGAVERRLAACAQLLDIESRYWWKGEIESANETLVLFKTVPKRVGALFAYVRTTHPYEVPEIAEVDVPRVDGGYLRYLASTLDASALLPPRPGPTRRAAPRARAGRPPRRTRARHPRRSR
jgi:periplasmic divalent cation tolerance protein